jgi:hypothetical protein
MIMFLFIMFLVCSSSTFDMVMIDNEFMYIFAKCLFTRGLSGRSHVSVVLRCYLPANVSYWSGRMVVRGSDSSIESYIVRFPLIGQAETTLRRKSYYALAFFSNIPYT